MNESDTERSLKVGDVVRLRSGSPKMTIEGIVGEYFIGSAECVWFISGPTSDKTQREVFQVGTLELAKIPGAQGVSDG